ncbi:hypothetical protein CAPTEDRAFT_188576 [Capitella teleta]|uniref:Uncharacterized protein n=1 Tax=Capitella teleta TaxID=283909 RepID=R7UHP6_CAPTE|nr:hypothetical protein CAPTEDRAFT_188576 [Capitella teleta]|eukprot:ELU06049.1 hypothetical protein CAPTEDRAFT_188576 [Capitella teleta]
MTGTSISTPPPEVKLVHILRSQPTQNATLSSRRNKHFLACCSCCTQRDAPLAVQVHGQSTWDSIPVPEQPRNGEAPSREPPSTAGLHTSKPVVVTAEAAGGAPWSTVVKRKTIKKRDEARMQLRDAAKDLRVVVGTEKGTVLKGCRPTKQLFVNRLERCSTDTVKKYMISKGVTREMSTAHRRSRG